MVNNEEMKLGGMAAASRAVEHCEDAKERKRSVLIEPWNRRHTLTLNDHSHLSTPVAVANIKSVILM